ncbi:MAG: response regulator [Alphaproteobacteria bacterium]
MDAEVQLRQGLRNILMQEGKRGVRDVSTVSGGRDGIRKPPPDLLVVDSRIPDGELIAMIEVIRFKRLGSNPFLTIIVMVWNPNREMVDRITKCGVDDLLVKSIAPTKLMERINYLAGTANRLS